MIRLKVTFLFLVLIVSCRPDESEEVYPVVHYNINIVADQTNRVEQKAQNTVLLHDTTIINRFINLYYPNLYGHRRDLEQKDILRFYRVSPYNALPDTLTTEVSLRRFPNQGERINYVLPEGKYTNPGGLKQDLNDLKRTVAISYETRNKERNSGDLFTFFSSSLTELNILKDTLKFSHDGIKYEEYHRNVLIVITDGYLEYGNYRRTKDCKANKCRYLNQSLIDEIRSVVNVEDLSVEKVLEKYDYGIIPVQNELLASTDLIFLEFYDRSRSPSGSARISPTDVEITKAVWMKWMKESGVKSAKIYEVLNNKEAISRILEQDILYY